MTMPEKLGEEVAYEAPQVVAVGALELVTLGQSDGNVLDNDFNAGTSKGDLTFS
jgi:hypothetical protein